MDGENSAEVPVEEKCSVCGKPLMKGEGRFRRSDGAVCIECHDRPIPGKPEDAKESL